MVGEHKSIHNSNILEKNEVCNKVSVTEYTSHCNYIIKGEKSVFLLQHLTSEFYGTWAQRNIVTIRNPKLSVPCGLRF